MKSFAPKFFKYIRAKDQLNEEDLIASLDPKANRNQIIMTNQGQKEG